MSEIWEVSSQALVSWELGSNFLNMRLGKTILVP